MSFERLDVDSFLQVLLFTNAHSLARMACCSRLGAVAAYEAQQRPALLVLKGSLDQLAEGIREQLASRPMIAFLHYCSGQHSRAQEMLDFVRCHLPPETKVLGACTESLFCLLKPAGSLAKQGSELNATGYRDDEVGILLATLPEATASVYHVKPSRCDDSDDEECSSSLEASETADADTQPGSTEIPSTEPMDRPAMDLQLQSGTCAAIDPASSWLASLPQAPSEARSSDEVAPIAQPRPADEKMCPQPHDEADAAIDAVRAWLSSLPQAPSAENNNDEGSSSGQPMMASNETTGLQLHSEASAAMDAVGSWVSSLPQAPSADESHAEVISSSRKVRASVPIDDLPSVFELDPPPQVIVVHIAMRRNLVEKLQETYPQAAIIGGVPMGAEVLVSSKAKSSFGRGVGVLAIQGNAPLFAMTCPARGGKEASVEDVRNKLRRVSQRVAADEKHALGALLFTCNARGPRMFGTHANDARLFQAHFPTTPLLGHYAGGEVGPMLIDGGDETEFLCGNACIQGFTAVFGIFLVPRKQAASRQFVQAMLYGQVQESFQELRSKWMQIE
eukprot:TRINITY_DN29373_c0_g1_i1.p1 TRINITY_DN29373_c0_g1~~TRINITY_DN29373_c0_g1_i1.p1  ORF type:complete len:563 (+),score=100.23 TRINITY_DN29373_c0_g1_i1:26-1714(+)